jgi:hypothetical protein
MKAKTMFVAVILSLVLVLKAADRILPDPKLTPGDFFTNVTVEQICTRGYANGSDVLNNGHGVRYVPRPVKWKVFKAYFGKVPAKTGNYEVDHLISLELGGSNDPKNLWPESYLTTPYNARVKDKLEDRMAALVRHELKTNGPAAATKLLKRFQHEIATNWIAVYPKYIPTAP